MQLERECISSVFDNDADGKLRYVTNFHESKVNPNTSGVAF